MKTFVSIQYARAFAAIIVVYTYIFSNRVPAYGKGYADYGLWGVDIFFVISGFIMTCSVEDRHFSASRFALNRAKRIFPLYWIALTIWIVSRMLISDGLKGADTTSANIFQSYFLIPHFHAVFTNHIWPVLVPGWTLQLEIFFYGLISLSIAIVPNRWFCATIGAVLTLSIIGIFARPEHAIPSTYTNPLLLEFSAGMLLAKSRTWLASIGTFKVAITFIVIAILIAFPAMHAPIEFRALFLGVPAVVIIAGFLTIETLLRDRPLKLGLMLGDASYSLYLLHPIAISAAAVVWQKAHLPVGNLFAALVFPPAAMFFTVGVSLLSFRFIEKPIMFRFRNKISDPLTIAKDVEQSAI